MKLNEVVPLVSIPSTGSEAFSLSALRGRNVVLYFYPKDDTPGCTTEGLEFNQRIAEFRKANTEVFGISRDGLVAHGKFIGKYGFNFELLADEDEVLCRIFDVIKEKNLYGKKFLGIERSTFVIDAKGRLVAEYRKVKAPGHAQVVLEFVKSL